MQTLQLSDDAGNAMWLQGLTAWREYLTVREENGRIVVSVQGKNGVIMDILLQGISR